MFRLQISFRQAHKYSDYISFRHIIGDISFRHISFMHIYIDRCMKIGDNQ